MPREEPPEAQPEVKPSYGIDVSGAMTVGRANEEGPETNGLGPFFALALPGERSI